MNTEDFVTYEQAVKLKKLGFNWTSYNYYDNDGFLITISHDEYYSEFEGKITAPTLSQVQKWLCKVTKIYIEISYLEDERKWTFSIINLKVNKRAYFTMYDDYTELFDTPESALSKGIDIILKEI